MKFNIFDKVFVIYHTKKMEKAPLSGSSSILSITGDMSKVPPSPIPDTRPMFLIFLAIFLAISLCFGIVYFFFQNIYNPNQFMIQSQKDSTTLYPAKNR